MTAAPTSRDSGDLCEFFRTKFGKEADTRLITFLE